MSAHHAAAAAAVAANHFPAKTSHPSSTANNNNVVVAGGGGGGHVTSSTPTSTSAVGSNNLQPAHTPPGGIGGGGPPPPHSNPYTSALYQHHHHHHFPPYSSPSPPISHSSPTKSEPQGIKKFIFGPPNLKYREWRVQLFVRWGLKPWTRCGNASLIYILIRKVLSLAPPPTYPSFPRLWLLHYPYIKQGSRGIRQWPMNRCIYPMMIYKIAHSCKTCKNNRLGQVT